MDRVYQAVYDGHGFGVAGYLGMKYTEVHYALQKLDKEGRIRKEKGEWVVA